jgi:transglutaminase-like putative cysteine protease
MSAAVEMRDDDERLLSFGPAEGWLALLALVAIMFTVGGAVDAAMWAGYAPRGDVTQTSFLASAGVLAVIVGLLLAKSRLRGWVVNLAGAAIGAVYLLNAISAAVSPAASIVGRLRGLNQSLAVWLNDVLVVGIRSAETSIFLLIIGALVWSAGLYAAIAVFRSRRPIVAVIPAGLILLVNVSLTVRDQFPQLIVFAAAVLLLVVRMNLHHQLAEWHARGMRDTNEVAGAFMRGGAFFVALAIAGSAVLAVNASSAPLARAWRDADSRLLQIGYDINRWIGGVSGDVRGPNVLFSPSQTIRDFWESSNEDVFSATTSDGQGHYWRGVSYDDFDGRTWQQRDGTSQPVAAGDELLAGMANDPRAQAGRAEISVTVTPIDYRGDVFVAPDTPLTVDRPAEVLTHGPGGPFIAGRLVAGVLAEQPYTATSLVRDSPEAEPLTANELAADGRLYPAWARRYVEIRAGSMGDGARAIADQIVEQLPAAKRDPYHIAEAIQNFLFRGGGFKYKTDIRGVCRAENVVDCFLRVRVGYCEQFATTMVMLLRAQEIPARYVVGYLPGQRHADGSYLISRNAAHAWVEVYFPTYGWIRFDPTPGNADQGQAPTTLPAGPSVSPPPAGANFPGQGELEFADDPIGGGLPGGADTTPAFDPSPAAIIGWAPLILGAAVLGALALLLGAWLLRRPPIGKPEAAYSSVTALARRLGYGPRPAQTAYEFTDGLAELVPQVRPELHLLAVAKVESTYAHRSPAPTMVASLSAAYRRVRLGLLRLVFRRRGRSLLPRPRGPRATEVPRG